MGVVLCLIGGLSNYLLNYRSKTVEKNLYFSLIFITLALSSLGSAVAAITEAYGEEKLNAVIFVAKIFTIAGGYWYFALYNQYLTSSIALKKNIATVWNRTFFSLTIAMSLLLACNVFGRYLYTVENGKYILGKAFWLTGSFEIAVLIADLILVISCAKHLKKRDLTVHLICILFPIATAMAQLAYGKIHFLDAAIVIVAVVMLLHRQAQISDALVDEQKKVNDQKLELMTLKEQNMIGQIQPHFIYNSLTAIVGIEGMPEEAQDAIGDFSNYLRENLDTLNNPNLVSFDKELDHIKKYVSLEKLRFGERVNVLFDIKCSDFFLPAMTVQMLVENAIKHGITQKEEGGTVTVSSEKKGDSFVVTVADDGVGFDTEKEITGNHIGINSIRKRLKYYVDGTLEITSEVGVGTTAVITIPEKKKGETEE